MAGTVKSLGCDITIIGRKKGPCCESDLVPFKTIRFRMLVKKGFLFYKFFNLRLFFFLLFHRFDVLVSNDLDTLLPNYLISKLKRLPLVYDSHEYFTGVPELQGRPFVKWVWKTIERNIVPDLEYVITVSEPIAKLYNEIYGINPVVIRNMSKNSSSIIPYRKKDLGIEECDLLLVLQGTGINIDKGGEELLDAVKKTSGVSLMIIGGGDIFNKLVIRVKKLNLEKRIKFYSSVSWELLMKYTRSADIGMCLEKDTNLNYRYSLPNKLFDYISAGIPVISGNLPEISKIITDFECGLTIEIISPEKISGAVVQLMKDPGRLVELKLNSQTAFKTLNWEIESEKVKSMYFNILNRL